MARQDISMHPMTDPSTLGAIGLIVKNADTASNIGMGEGVFAQKEINDLKFKSLYAVNDEIQITSDASTIYFDVSANFMTKSYVDGSLADRDASITVLFDENDVQDGSITTLYNYNNAQDSSITTLDGSVTLLFNENDVQDTSIIRLDGSVNNLFDNKVDSASNIGTGQGTFSQKLLTDLEFKSIDASTSNNVNVYADGSTIYLDASIAETNPGGSDKQVQYNDKDSFAGDESMTYDPSLYSFTVGSNNVTGSYSGAFGQDNSIGADHSFAAGIDNIISDVESGAFGSGNIISARRCFAAGRLNTIIAENSVSFGHTNSVSGSYSFLSGKGNIASGGRTFVSGEDNDADGSYSFAVGQGVTTNGNYSFGFGKGFKIKSAGNYSVIFGLNDMTGTELESPNTFSIVGGRAIIGGIDASSLLHLNGGVGDISTGLTFGAGNTAIYESYDNILTLTGSKFGINTPDPSSVFDIDASTMGLRQERTIESASDTGTKGDLCWDPSYMYICIATDTWQRSLHSSW